MISRTRQTPHKWLNIKAVWHWNMSKAAAKGKDVKSWSNQSCASVFSGRSLEAIHQISVKLPLSCWNLRLNNWIPLLQCNRSTIATHVQFNVLKSVWPVFYLFITFIIYFFFSKSISVASETGRENYSKNCGNFARWENYCICLQKWTCSVPFRWRERITSVTEVLRMSLCGSGGGGA